jgi:formylglycine-generating enzyme required for sulfatase activity
MVYEASRADATGSDEGIRTDRVCSGPGVVPWVRVTWDEARNACMTAGMDLCPEAIWQAACNGPASADFPYGTAYVAGQCRGSRDPQYGCDVGGTCEAAPTGSLPTCTSASGLFDASGNVREWVLQGEECCRYVRGGSFRDDGDDLRCSNTIPDTHQIPSGSRLADVGFRCCAAQ